MTDSTIDPSLQAIASLIDVIAKLRDPDRGCPWDLAQTPQSLTPYILEEAYETVHAIESKNSTAIVEELGDLLLQIILQAQIASETNQFTLVDIAANITAKLIRRHPHVFGDTKVTDAAEVNLNWERIKAEEKGNKSAQLSDKLSSYAEKLPTLTAAMKISQSAAKAGFEWDDIAGVWEKFDEELAELKEAISSNDRSHQQSELGDLLFTVVNLGRWLDLDPEAGLRGTNQRFVDRIQQMEKYTDRPLTSYSIEELEKLWQQAKKQLKVDGI
jgi:XTP/dITP diphosphohydrolase